MTPQNDLAHRLIRRAARSAPPAVAERLEEEWSADLAARTGTFSRLRLAIGCWWATGVITRDFAVPQVAASSAGGGARTLLAEAQYDFPLLSRRTVTFVVIAGVHLLLIYALVFGFAQRVPQTPPTVTNGSVLTETRPEHPAPPLIPVIVKPLTTGKIDLVIPEPTNFEIPDDPTGLEGKTGPQLIVDSPPPPPVIHRLLGGPGKGFPNTDDFYPAASRRLAETGATTVQVCVDTQGRLARDPVVTQSSGIGRLDDGALKLAKAGSGHYRPTTENDQPVNSCYPYRIRFRLDD
jgi:TonB family protein